MKKSSLPIGGALFLVAAMILQFVVSYQREKKDLVAHVEYQMELAHKVFIYEVYDMYEATEEIVRYFPEFDRSENELFTMLQSVLVHFPILSSCYVSYIPACSPTPGQLYAPCASRRSQDTIVVHDFASSLNYLERDWYIYGLTTDDEEGYWSLPYNDYENAAPIFTNSQKVYDSQGRLVGVAAADCTLKWTKQMLEGIMPYPDAVCQLFSTDSTLIVSCGNVSQIDDMIVLEKELSPTSMRLVIGVPKHHISDDIADISLLTFLVLVSGLLIVGLLLRHMLREQDAFVRVETANRVLEKALQIARGIQLGMLPNNGEKLTVKGDQDETDAQIEAMLIPMHEVGGDLYDYSRKGDDLFFIIGDVSGKGVPAAMFMSATVNLFRSAVLRLQSPKAIMEDMNQVLSENNPSLMFVTAFVGRLHVPTGELLYCNAGHCEPIHLRTGISGNTTMTVNLEPNIPLGFDSKFRFKEQGMLLGEGDTIVLYTDGITEARDAQHAMMGLRRWQSIVESQGAGVEKLLLQVKEFIGTAKQSDDITLMTIRKTTAVQPLILRGENKAERWPLMRAALREYGLCTGMEPGMLKKTELVIEEAVVNVFNYSQATWIELELNTTGTTTKALEVTIRDNGIAFDPTEKAEVDIDRAMQERQIGGLGIDLMRKIADEVHYQRSDDINTLTILKNI